MYNNKIAGKRAKKNAIRLLDDFLVEVTSEIMKRIMDAKTEIELENYVKSIICKRLA